MMKGLTMKRKLIWFVAAVTMAVGSEVTLRPSAIFYPPTYFGYSSVQSLILKNETENSITVSSITLTGMNSNEFNTTNGADSCTGETITVGDTCMFEVRFEPQSNGTKSAVVEVDFDSGITTAYLTNFEDTKTQASRRLPPVMYSLNVPAAMIEDQSFTIQWSLLGYHDDYKSIAAFFDCDGITNGTCGDTYSTNFHASGALTPDSTETGNWTYKGVSSKEFHYSYTFTPNENINHNRTIVIRFYRINNNDSKNGKNSLSALIPGDMNATYYDNAGRRISLPFNTE